MKNYTTIKESWEDYRLRVVPVNASPVQVRECRLAFYGGAATTLAILMNMTNAGVSETQAMARLSILHGECDEWLEKIRKEIPTG